MNKEIVKKAYSEAENSLQEKQKEQVKQIVLKTLERLDEVDKLIKDLEEERKILKLDIDDLKEGRLDRIEERQSKDEKSKKTSVVEVIKEVHHIYNDRWYQPYVVTIREFPTNLPLTVYGNCISTNNSANAISGTLTTTDFSGSVTQADTGYQTFTVNSSTIKNNVIGTYIVHDKTVHLR